MSDDGAVIHNKAMIANNLAMLAKNKSMITVSLGGKDTLLTALIDVDLKDDVIAFDSSPSEKLNAKLLALRSVKFSTVFNGVQVAFTGTSVKKGKFSGYDAFVMPFPTSLYWFDRRGAFRVPAPTTMHVATCTMTIPPPDENSKPEYHASYERATNKIRNQLLQKIEDDAIENEKKFAKAYARMTPEEKRNAKAEREKYLEELQENPIVPDENLINVFHLKLFDVSITGCAAVNVDEEFSFFLHTRQLYENCVLVMPENGEATVNLEIMIKRKIEPELEEGEVVKSKKAHFEEFIGFKFIDPKQSAESTIFRYIQALDRLNKKR